MSEVKKTIAGTLKNTDLRNDRERGSYEQSGTGDSEALDEIPMCVDDQNASIEQDADPKENRAHRLGIVKAQIRERCRDHDIVVMVERRLFNGDAYVRLAADSGVPENTLRSWVSRVRDYLQIPKTNSNGGNSRDDQ